MVTTEERIEALERRMAAWEQRLNRVEGPVPSPRPAVRPTPPITRAAPTPPPAPLMPSPPAPPRPSVEQLLGGRVLAWAGGIAVLAGLAFLFALGVSSGWLDETRRCAMGALAASALVGVGAYLQERRGRTTAALAMVGAGLGGAFLAITFAAQAYDLVPTAVAAGLAAAVGGLGTMLALRWNAAVVGGIGLVGAAFAPALAGATGDPGGVVLLWLAAAAGVAVVVHRRWSWLSLVLAVVVTPQWLLFLVDFDGSAANPLVAVTVLVAFGCLGVLAAIGYELRVPSVHGLRPSSTFLLAGTALVLALAGYPLLEDAAGEGAAIGWLVALAAAHLAGGLRARRSPRITGEVALLVTTLGVVLADVGFALALQGAPRALGWTLAAVGFAWLAGRAQGRLDPGAAHAGLGAHVALAAAGVVGELDAAVVGDAALSAVGGATLAAFAASAFASARLATAWRRPLDALALVALAGLAALTLDGVALSVAWAGEAAALGAVATRTRDGVAAWGALGHLALAAGWCLIDQASPVGLAEPTNDLVAAVLGLGAVGLAAARLALTARSEPTLGRLDQALAAVAAVAALYAASLAAVALPGAGEAMQAQLQLTALWAIVGLAALVGGLTRNIAVLRTSGLGLLGLAAAKLFLVDLSTLAAAWRVAACMAVGGLLLLAAFIHARLRPEPLPDLRDSAAAR